MDPEAFFTWRPAPGAGLRELMAGIEAGAASMKQQGGRRVLVDLTGIERPPGEVESLLLSHHVGWNLAALERLAIVVPGRTGQGERVARHLGANMRVFTSLEEAAAWLQAGAA